MISQISSVFLVYTLLCVGSWSTDSWVCGPKNVTVLELLKRCKNITVCNANATSPEAVRFHNSIFSTLQMHIWSRHDAHRLPGRMPPSPPSRRHWVTSNRSEKLHSVLYASAGVGRTGTYIAVDTLMHQLRQNSTVDVYGIVYAMRLHRPYMVQTEVILTVILAHLLLQNAL